MVISGKDLAQSLKAKMAEQVATFPAKYGRVPHLVVILVGEDPGSVSYVTGKAAPAEEVGIRNTTIRRSAEIGEGSCWRSSRSSTPTPTWTASWCSCPCPGHIDEDRVIAAIDKGKDVDGFHPLNVAALWQKQPWHAALHPQGDHPPARRGGGRNRRPQGRGGRPQQHRGAAVAKLLLDRNATVTVTHSRTRDLRR